MKNLPIFFNISGQKCLVVGGGDVATRKVRQLLNVSGDVVLVAPQLSVELQGLLKNGGIRYLEATFSEDLIEGCALVVAATNDDSVNEAVSKSCKNRQIPVNVVDNPDLCSFIMPSIIDRDPVQIAISTGGASPVLARLLRARLETMIPSAYGRLAELMKNYRVRVKEKFPKLRERRRFWERVLSGPVAEMLLVGQDRAALRALEQQLQQWPNESEDKIGEVYLVGGGPGDPDLLTFRALRLMQQADVVLYDRLVSPVIVDLARKDAERIYVGKELDQHTVPQKDINQLLITLAKQGKRVLRLKGGDPFIFGRGGEEIEDLAAAGISFQVVPGITAASGCAAYAGIPLTHRDYAQSCIFITGHLKDGKLDFNWPALVQPGQTLAIYMGVKGIKLLSPELIKHGMEKQTPAAIIQQGTRPEQKIFISNLVSLPDVVDNNDIKPPAMVIVGEVVKLHEKLEWFDP